MIENIHKVSIGNVQQAKTGAARVAQNTDRTDLILIFEKNVLWYILSYKI